ncbi:MAG: hypothetical protein HY650_10750 [Acidobacteria bacterium]|nr:hypothetical protein [Acidobacteriota bacterium]
MEKSAILGEADIRAALHSRLHREHAREADTLLIEELGLCCGRVRIDVAVVNGLLRIPELHRDRWSRFP